MSSKDKKTSYAGHARGKELLHDDYKRFKV